MASHRQRPYNDAAKSLGKVRPMRRPAHQTIILPVVRHLQEESWSCGTAALKIVLDSVGRPARERELINLCGAAPHHGTPPWAMATGLERLGVSHEVVDSATIDVIEQRIRSLQLCIVDYQSWGRRGRDYQRGRTGHYSVVFGYDPTHLLLADPAKGKRSPAREPWG